MAQEHAVSLTIDTGDAPVAIDVWSHYTVTLSMFGAGQPWSFVFWRSTVADTTWRALARQAKLLARVQLTIDGAPQLSGYLEDLDRGTHEDRNGGMTAGVGGRDLAGLAMDFEAAPTTAVRGVQLQAALSEAFSSFGVPVRVTAAVAAREIQSRARPGARGAPTSPRRKKVDIMRPKAGETVWQYAQSVVRRLGYMMWIAPSADGSIGLVVDVPDYAQVPLFTFERTIGRGTFGATGNILAGREVFSIKGVPTDVHVYTGSARGDVLSGRAKFSTANPKLFDRTITRGFVAGYLPVLAKHIRSGRARDVAHATAEAERVIADAMRGFRQYKLRVQGHGQTVNGVKRLYAINTMASVLDEYLIDDEGAPLREDMLITDVEFVGARGAGEGKGQYTNITLAPKGSIVVTPVAE
jgi:hypothetical protein